MDYNLIAKLEEGGLLVERTRDFRIDTVKPIKNDFNDPRRKERLKAHQKRIRRELRNVHN